MSQRSFDLAILVLGLCAVVGTVGSVFLAASRIEVPNILSGIVGTCLGAIGGLLSQPPGKS